MPDPTITRSQAPSNIESQVSRPVHESLFDLKGEVAAVIGGTGVLGGMMAESLAEFGAQVVVLGRNKIRGNAQAEKIKVAGGNAYFQPVDAQVADSVTEAIWSVRREFGEPTILVNAAGGNQPNATRKPHESVCDVSLEAWREVIDANLIGGVLTPSLLFGEAMISAGKGSIINIASMAGMTPVSRVGAYSAAKAAVINLTKYLALEWGRQGVRVNAISPGFFPAEQNRKLLFNPDGTMTQRSSKIIEHTPMHRFGSAEELAGAVVWLASSKASSFVTGQNIVVDGGFSSTTI